MCPPNTAATGQPTITGTAQVGQALTADTSGITDINGLPDGAYTYQWVRDGSDIDGLTAKVYWPTTSDADSTISVKVSFTDGACYDEGPLTSDAVTVLGSDTVRVPWSATMTVGTDPEGRLGYGSEFTDAALSDPDFNFGLTTYTIHVIAQFTFEVMGQTTSQLGFAVSPIVPDSAFSKLILQVGDTEYSFGAADGVNDNQEDNGTSFVWNIGAMSFEAGDIVSLSLRTVNTAATGQPTVTGTPVQVGEPLPTDTSGITDANYIPEDAYSYQWSSSDDGSTYEDIDTATATDAVFRPLQSELGKTLKVTVTFTDGAGFDEGPLTTAATAAVVASPHGNVIYSAALTVGEDTTGSSTLLGYAFRDLGSLAPLSFTDEGQRNALSRVRFDKGSGALEVIFRSELSAGDFILRLGDEAILIEDPGANTTFSFTNHSLNWNDDDEVEVRLSKNRPADGQPSITGAPEVGQVLTADRSGIDDADGVYTYQWTSSSDGTTYANIGNNATASTYTLVAADQGKTIKVTVSFTGLYAKFRKSDGRPRSGAAPPVAGLGRFFTVRSRH